MPCKYRLVIKIALDKCHRVCTLTKDLLYLSPLKKKKKTLFSLDSFPFNLVLYRFCAAAAYYDVGLFPIRNPIITR